MAIPHAKPAEIVEIRPLAEKLKDTLSHTIIKTDQLEVLRIVLPAGKEIAQHKVLKEVTVQCIEGKIVLRCGELDREMTSGTLLYLAGEQEHALKAIEDSSLLVTILLR